MYSGYFHPVSSLTESLRPVYSRHEVELCICEGATLYSGDDKTGPTGCVFLSTHRLIWQEASTATFLHLALIKKIEQQLSPTTDFLAYQSALLSTASSLINPPAPGYLRLSFQRQDALSLLLSSLQSALTAKTWTVAASPSSPASSTSPSVPSKRSFSTTSAGVSGIIRDVDASSRRTDAQLDAAFADLTALSKHARDVVELAERFSRQVQASGSGSEEETALTSLLTSMGLPSPVTRNSVPASSFHLQLARQLSDFISAHPRFRSAQMLTLTDVYCLYNRARGTELISPADCLRACQLMGSAGAGGSIAMHKLDSGLLVLCRPGLVERGVEDVLRVVSGREGGDGVSLLALSAALGLSVLLLEERCRLAERSGKLVRDESVEGIKWFDNRFDKWSQTQSNDSLPHTVLSQ